MAFPDASREKRRTEIFVLVCKVGFNAVVIITLLELKFHLVRFDLVLGFNVLEQLLLLVRFAH